MPEPNSPVRTLSLTTRVAIAVTGVLLVGGILVTLAAFAYGRQAAREAYDQCVADKTRALWLKNRSAD